jgi:hypothetical protein
MAGNSTVGSDNEGCAKEMQNGALTNQFGTWPYGRAGWCAGQDVKPWTYDITQWVDVIGNQNSLQYQGLYNGQNYEPQNEQSGANQDIHANIWVVYYTNISMSNGSAQMDSNSVPAPPSNDDEHVQMTVEILREEECATEDE